MGLIAYGDQRYFLTSDTGTGHFDRIMELLALSKAEGTVPLETALPQEEAHWGYHSSLIVITSSHRSGWTTALRELIRRRVRVAVVLLDGASFGGIFNTLENVPELYGYGVPPYVVRRGDDIPLALSHIFPLEAYEGAEQVEGVEVTL